MATVTIDATNPSSTVNWAVLRNLALKICELDRRNSLQLGTVEYTLLWELATGATDGKTGGTSTQAVVTYS